jgi:hypothetical protein
MITAQQLFRHGFIATTGSDNSPLFTHGVVNGILISGVISGGVFHFPVPGRWEQAKNISHLKHLYFKATKEKLVPFSDEEWKRLSDLIN